MKRLFPILLLAAGLVPTATPLGPVPVAGAEVRTVTRRIPYDVACSPSASVCPAPFATTVRTLRVFKLEFVAAADLCTPIRIDFVVDGDTFGDPDGYVVAPGKSTGVVAEGRSPRRRRDVTVVARDAPGGSCTDGNLTGWSGTLKATVSKRARG